MTPWLEIAVRLAAWAVALCWAAKLAAALWGLRGIADLLGAGWDRMPLGEPTITVVVPACNEERDVRACLESLVGQDYVGLDVVAFNDRSTDATGAIMDELGGRYPGRLRVIHVEALPDGWLGKTHAMASAASSTSSDYVLFTDADVVFRGDALRRSLAYAVESGADHLITLPTTIIKRWDEAALLGFFQILGLWGAPLWRVASARSRVAIGVGAFNLVRRTAYEQVGGFAALRMEIVEDLGLGKRIKQAGLKQRVAFGRGLVSLHWAAGANGIVNVMTKNVFSVFRFNVALMLVTCGWLVGFSIVPYVGLFYLPVLVPSLLMVGSVFGLYGLMSRHSGIPARNAVYAPFAAVMFVYTMLRSTLITLRQGGVIWRGTFYPLGELKKNAAPLR
ncbi:glycosyltransferase [Granulicella tundricola]|uniref:Glycosyl transferase family 2 n=1 Tax=Granulicella tundricola (strain ATCC BAA-1859 / DSM 23138 / MP5ACTX9) TaxID=1198114 RepID=E8WYV9_GRATM|nr:glycosyltransferase family 2 protein [Granulicella tundricola]ADW68795.1 glycosyl transferase family 2 [Granulicella tundricola MP5ACTX9]